MLVAGRLSVTAYLRPWAVLIANQVDTSRCNDSVCYPVGNLTLRGKDLPEPASHSVTRRGYFDSADRWCTVDGIRLQVKRIPARGQAGQVDRTVSRRGNKKSGGGETGGGIPLRIQRQPVSWATSSPKLVMKATFALMQDNKSVGRTSSWVQGNEWLCADDVRGSGDE